MAEPATSTTEIEEAGRGWTMVPLAQSLESGDGGTMVMVEVPKSMVPLPQSLEVVR